MFRSDEDGLTADTVHVNAGTSLEVVEVDEAVFSDEEDDPMLFRDLHSDGEIILGFRGEEDIDCLLGEHRVRSLVINFNDV